MAALLRTKAPRSRVDDEQLADHHPTNRRQTAIIPIRAPLRNNSPVLWRGLQPVWNENLPSVLSVHCSVKEVGAL